MSKQLAVAALLRANARAGELRREALHQDSHVEPGILRGAPTHSAAHLLSALDEIGWMLVSRDALLRVVERVTTLGISIRELDEELAAAWSEDRSSAAPSTGAAASAPDRTSGER